MRIRLDPCVYNNSAHCRAAEPCLCRLPVPNYALGMAYTCAGRLVEAIAGPRGDYKFKSDAVCVSVCVHACA